MAAAVLRGFVGPNKKGQTTKEHHRADHLEHSYSQSTARVHTSRETLLYKKCIWFIWL